MARYNFYQVIYYNCQKKQLYTKVFETSEKPTLALMTSLLVAKTSIKDFLLMLNLVFYIYHLIQLKKNKVRAVINLDKKVNVIILGYILKLGMKIRLTNVKTQKINSSIFQIFETILANFQIKDKLNQAQYFQKLFLLADINIEVVLEIFFLIFKNTNIYFVKKKLISKFYTTAKALHTIKQIKIINKKSFAKKALNKNVKILVLDI